MANVDFFFSEIVRWHIIALILLLATCVFMRFLRQPLERMRVIQISLVTLCAMLLLGVADVIPTIDLALIPADSMQTAVSISDSIDAADEMRNPGGDEIGELASAPDFSIVVPPLDDSSTVTELSSDGNVIRDAKLSIVEVSRDINVISLMKNTFVYGILFVSLMNVAYLGIGFIATYRLVASSTPVSDAAAQRVDRIVGQFAESGCRPRVRCAKTRVPIVTGIWRPTILLPETLCRPDADEMALRHSLAHEWGHIARCDLLTWQLISLCQIFLWIQPFYWVLRRELRIAQDQLADQFATGHTGDHANYAETLLEFCRSRQIILPGSLAMAEGKSNLYRRIEMLINDKFLIVRVARKSIVLPFAVLMLGTGVVLTSLQFSQAAPAPIPFEQPDLEEDKNASTKVADDEESAEHSGVVTDADTNKPIAGVTVTVTRMNSKDWRELAITESTTDENGKYAFTIPPDQLSQRYLYIMFDIDHPEYARRHCGSYGYSMIVKNLENGEQPWFSKLQMVRGEKVSGRLVDENQQPIAGAQLRFNSAPKSGFDRVRSSFVDGVSGEDGRFEAVVTRDGAAKLSIVPPRHCMKHIDLGDKRGDLGDISLEDGVPVEGIVQDAEGNPMRDLWVNLTPEDDRREASYEMKRSCKTDAQGVFRSRPVKSGKYLVQVQTKATGALEKQTYANFHDVPPPAMFVDQTIHVAEDSARKPVILRAVPHVLITCQFNKPNGDISPGHSPSLFGSIDGKRMWIRKGKRTGAGAYELMAPHGFEDVELRFVTNEHSALMIQFEGGELSPQDSYRFERLESDISNIRVVRYRAAIAKIKIIDETGTPLKEARIHASYALPKDATDAMMMGNQIGWNREDGLFRLSSIVPNREFTVHASLDGYEATTESITMQDEERRTVTITLKKAENESESAGV